MELTLMLYLKSPDSNAMSESTAAISCGLVMPYLIMALTRKGAACSLVTHSSGAGAPAQDEELGAMARRMEAAVSPAARGWRALLLWGKESGILGMTRAEIVLLMAKTARAMFGNGLENIFVMSGRGLWCRKGFLKMRV